METNRPPAIVQQAQKTCAWYRQQYEENEKKHWAVQDALLANFKESGIWKSEFNTWGAACELLLGISQGRANERILRHKQSALAQTTSPHADRANPQDKKEQKALSQVEKAREVTPEPEKEEEENREKIKPDTQKLWDRTYYRARSQKWNATFRQAAAMFFRENHYWPPKTLRLMPKDSGDWYRKVADVPYESLNA